jgi:type VI secretion system protein ImpC
MLSSKMAELVSKHRFMPMLSMKGRPEVRLGGFGSLAGGPLAGSWQPVTASSAVEEEPAKPARKAEAQETESEQPVEAATEATESTEGGAEAPAEAASDPELDKLLASLNEEPAAAPAEPAAEAIPTEEEMDPELAKLLKELG